MQIRSGTVFPAQALIFDMDGTLVDSTAVVAPLWRKWAARYGVDAQAVLAASQGRRAVETMQLFAPEGVDIVAEAAEHNRASAGETKGLVAVPGAAKLLQSLGPENWAVVTSAQRSVAQKWLSHAGLPVPRVLVTAEDVTKGKPDPEGYIRAAARLGVVPSGVVVFEDAPAGLAAGQAAGARIVAVAATQGTAGFAAYDWVQDFSGVSFSSGLLRF